MFPAAFTVAYSIISCRLHYHAFLDNKPTMAYVVPTRNVWIVHHTYVLQDYCFPVLGNLPLRVSPGGAAAGWRA